MSTRPRVVLDTNVLVSAIRSNRGASFRVLTAVDRGKFEISLSVPLVLEYEYAMIKAGKEVKVSKRTVTDIIDYLCHIGRHVDIFYLWRPFLKDPGDDMVLELAVADSCDAIVTHNVRDFAGIEDFGLQLWTPQMFLHLIN
ncbi:MAG: putative toxin-antitoxin system toxin component, PIN family [Rhodothermales bacterium]|nr:putative toxin-antitoxin system toxin component, PIN family [Rhodothermales bacterium]